MKLRNLMYQTAPDRPTQKQPGMLNNLSLYITEFFTNNNIDITPSRLEQLEFLISNATRPMLSWEVLYEEQSTCEDIVFPIITEKLMDLFTRIRAQEIVLGDYYDNRENWSINHENTVEYLTGGSGYGTDGVFQHNTQSSQSKANNELQFITLFKNYKEEINYFVREAFERICRVFY